MPVVGLTREEYDEFLGQPAHPTEVSDEVVNLADYPKPPAKYDCKSCGHGGEKKYCDRSGYLIAPQISDKAKKWCEPAARDNPYVPRSLR